MVSLQEGMGFVLVTRAQPRAWGSWERTCPSKAGAYYSRPLQAHKASAVQHLAQMLGAVSMIFNWDITRDSRLVVPPAEEKLPSDSVGPLFWGTTTLFWVWKQLCWTTRRNRRIFITLVPACQKGPDIFTGVHCSITDFIMCMPLTMSSLHS